MQVVRGGKREKVLIFDLVVGDIIHLNIGDQVPGDGIFIQGHQLTIDESSMTGESQPVSATSILSANGSLVLPQFDFLAACTLLPHLRDASPPVLLCTLLRELCNLVYHNKSSGDCSSFERGRCFLNHFQNHAHFTRSILSCSADAQERTEALHDVRNEGLRWNGDHGGELLGVRPTLP